MERRTHKKAASDGTWQPSAYTCKIKEIKEEGRKKS
jgi:hypothetical protein